MAKRPTSKKGAKAAVSLIGAIIPAISPGSLISERQRPVRPKGKTRKAKR
jgi:hypothetical protein